MRYDELVDKVIKEIEEEWRANGYFGDVREDSGLVYEVVKRILDRQ